MIRFTQPGLSDPRLAFVGQPAALPTPKRYPSFDPSSFSRGSRLVPQAQASDSSGAPLPPVGRGPAKKRGPGGPIEYQRAAPRPTQPDFWSTMPEPIKEVGRFFGRQRWLPYNLRPHLPQVKKAKHPEWPVSLPEKHSKSLLVIGGGLAGLSSALFAAERGVKVTLIEARPELGGKLSTTRTSVGDAGEFAVEHGLHMWFKNYHVFDMILEKLDLKKHFVPFDVVTTVFENPEYSTEFLQSRPKIYPLNLLNVVRRSDNLDLLDAVKSLIGMSGMLFYNAYKNDEHEDLSFEEWLQKKNIPDNFADILLKPAANVSLNSVASMDAAEIRRMVHHYFLGEADAADRTIPDTDHGTAVIDPWVAHLKDELEVDIRTGTRVPGLRFEEGRVVGIKGSDERFDQVILATHVPATKAILAASEADATSQAGLDRLRDQLAGLKVAPPYNVARAYLSKQPDTQVDKVLETPQSLPIDLIAQTSKLEEESHAWAEQTGGSVLEVHAYDTPELNGLSPAEVWAQLRPGVERWLPELQGAEVLGVHNNRFEDFTSYEKGQARLRPPVDAPVRAGLAGLHVAGDWVRADHGVTSHLMERAVGTGCQAAAEVLNGFGLRGIDIPYQPPYGPGLF